MINSIFSISIFNKNLLKKVQNAWISIQILMKEKTMYTNFREIADPVVQTKGILFYGTTR